MTKKGGRKMILQSSLKYKTVKIFAGLPKCKIRAHESEINSPPDFPFLLLLH